MTETDPKKLRSEIQIKTFESAGFSPFNESVSRGVTYIFYNVALNISDLKNKKICCIVQVTFVCKFTYAVYQTINNYVGNLNLYKYIEESANFTTP